MVTSTKRRMPDRRTYVLDTSVLLADPNALTRFDEHEVVLPIVVVTGTTGKLAALDVACVLRKPITADSLVLAVRKCLASAAGSAGC